MLSEQNETLTFTKEYTGSTENVVNSVLLGKADAGAIFSTELSKEPPEILGRIRTILRTEKIPSHPFSAHPRVPRDVRTMVRKTMLELSLAQDGAELMRQVRMPSPVPADYEKDYKALEGVDVKKLSDWGK